MRWPWEAALGGRDWVTAKRKSSCSAGVGSQALVTVHQAVVSAGR